MPLAELHIEDVRCLERVELPLDPRCTLFWGANGSGKTSVLESLFLLGRGRSFRTRSSERLIRHGQSRLVVFGRTGGAPQHGIGVEVSKDGGTRARIDQTNVSSLAELSTAFSVQVIDPEIHKLIEEGPNRRRRWLDWAVFHVEPGFVGHWVRYTRAVRQRNAALKAGQDPTLWDAELVRTGEIIAECRRLTVEALQPHWLAATQELLGFPIDLGYSRGWVQDLTLGEALDRARTRDQERGSTTVGPHRADLTLTLSRRAAREILSRGQQKLAAVALTMAQLELLKSAVDVRPTLLLDDPAAELDRDKLDAVLARVSRLECQLVVTALSKDFKPLGDANATFHVEHGRVSKL